MSKLCSNYYSSNGTWVCPAGVTTVYVLAHGGGAGGSGARNATGDTANAGDATTPFLVALTVVPNTTYTITIGTGGTGGVPRTTATQNGGTGVNTTFGSLYTFTGATLSSNTVLSSGPNGTRVVGRLAVKQYQSTATIQCTSGFVNYAQTQATSVSSYNGGRGGTPGYAGSVPGAGGAGNASGTGSNAVAGSGFGFGGAGAGAGSTGGGTGGAGGPGQMWIIWVE